MSNPRKFGKVSLVYLRFIREVSKIQMALDLPHHTAPQKHASTKMLHNLVASDGKLAVLIELRFREHASLTRMPDENISLPIATLRSLLALQ